MTTLRKMASKKALTNSAMLGAGILLSAMLVLHHQHLHGHNNR